MEVRITPKLAAELAHIATHTGRTPEPLAAAALALGMEAERRFLKAVEQGIASADAGRFIEDEQVLAWIEQREAYELSGCASAGPRTQ